MPFPFWVAAYTRNSVLDQEMERNVRPGHWLGSVLCIFFRLVGRKDNRPIKTCGTS